MRILKLSSIAFLSVCSLNAQAGLFSSADDFKCGRDDAISAVRQYIKDATGGRLQSASLTGADFLYNKPLKTYLDKENSIEISLAEVSTVENTSATQMQCKAKLSIQLPTETLDVVREVPNEIYSITSDAATLHNNAIVWKDYTYNIKLADNKKDISVSDAMRDQASNYLYKIVVMSVNKSEIIMENSTKKVEMALSEYREENAVLNNLWKSMPDSVRASMKASQNAWIKEKAIKCGKISDATSEIIPVKQRVETLKCQTQMTRERISFLGGDNQ
ncbi:lysozyme inhibitor LprI family protein [Pluralibacter gergoviae]|uniref:Lysozyme inhibitor LprI family protein n=1 Tax=Pluralibacter gergoviae TaxID=61647 RepID=A0AAW8HW74_PLUGE|nr:lysozyme inhibitor LprI family protein [Pluralibacter gergoviae]AVR04463.1 DUF1311 domain-containing protein [Pluralibacter gergoviae]KMK01366.1 hypothetical protein ABW08_23775 [Pluralibacter gergoviae]KMK21098.1 hypothetical protein ABW11_24555 [Pluralibacter gergoviae]MDQ2312717.1 lysozyme inhibitor LprI family protein [Pluralibacter gergoviae]SUB71188.1 Uncharacterized protein conserved in bacteria [Pluralibacter gergoviae]